MNVREIGSSLYLNSNNITMLTFAEFFTNNNVWIRCKFNQNSSAGRILNFYLAGT